jgi:hypothetical protein
MKKKDYDIDLNAAIIAARSIFKKNGSIKDKGWR